MKRKFLTSVSVFDHKYETHFIYIYSFYYYIVNQVKSLNSMFELMTNVLADLDSCLFLVDWFAKYWTFQATTNWSFSKIIYSES